MSKEIDWAALLDGDDSQERTEDKYNDVHTSGISGLLSVNSDIDTSLSESTKSRLSYTHQSSKDLNDSFVNLQSVHDLIAESPSPEPFRARSATSIKSNVTFSESEPEIFEIAQDINLLSIGDLVPSTQLSDPDDTESQTGYGHNDNIQSEISSKTQNADNYTEIVTEDYSDSELSEDIQIKSDGWKTVKDTVITKSSSIPVFMVSHKKPLKKDLSFKSISSMHSLRSVDSSIKSRKSSANSRTTTKSLSTKSAESSQSKSYHYTSFTDDVTTVSESSECVTESKHSVTKLTFQAPCCKCRCKPQRADLNTQPIPLSGIVLDPKTLSEIAQMNPEKIAFLNLMKAQYSLTKGLLDITTRIIDSDIESCTADAKYTTYEDTMKYIRKNQPYKRGRSHKTTQSKKKHSKS